LRQLHVANFPAHKNGWTKATRLCCDDYVSCWFWLAPLVPRGCCSPSDWLSPLMPGSFSPRLELRCAGNRPGSERCGLS